MPRKKNLLSENIFADILKNIKSKKYKKDELLPSERELMAIYKVSRVTIRRSLSKLEEQHVITCKPGVGYYVCGDTDKIKQTSNRIGLILNDESDLESIGIQILMDNLTESGYSYVTGYNRLNTDDENKCIERFSKLNLDGLIVYPALFQNNYSDLQKLIDKKFPIVVVGEPRNWALSEMSINKVNIVCLDNKSAMRLMLEQLCKAGKKSIYFVMEDFLKPIETFRKASFIEFFKTNNISLEKNSIAYLKTNNDSENIKQIKEMFSNRKHKPDAIISNSLKIANAVKNYCLALKLDKKNSLLIAKFGLIEQTETTFSSVNYSGNDYANEIIKSLKEQIKGTCSVKKIIIPCTFSN